MAVQGGPAYGLSQQPWAQPGRNRPLASLCMGRGGHRVVFLFFFFFLTLVFFLFFFYPYSKDQRHRDGNLPGDEEQAAKHFTEHVLVLGQQRHRVHPFQACPGEWPKPQGVVYSMRQLLFKSLLDSEYAFAQHLQRCCFKGRHSVMFTYITGEQIVLFLNLFYFLTARIKSAINILIGPLMTFNHLHSSK